MGKNTETTGKPVAKKIDDLTLSAEVTGANEVELTLSTPTGGEYSITMPRWQAKDFAADIRAAAKNSKK